MNTGGIHYQEHRRVCQASTNQKAKASSKTSSIEDMRYSDYAHMHTLITELHDEVMPTANGRRSATRYTRCAFGACMSSAWYALEDATWTITLDDETRSTGNRRCRLDAEPSHRDGQIRQAHQIETQSLPSQRTNGPAGCLAAVGKVWRPSFTFVLRQCRRAWAAVGISAFRFPSQYQQRKQGSLSHIGMEGDTHSAQSVPAPCVTCFVSVWTSWCQTAQSLDRRA